MISFSFETAPKIICEQGAAGRLGEIVRDMGVRHLFLVTDAGLVGAGLIDGALKSLSLAGVAVTVFSDVVADPPQQRILVAVEAAKQAQADGVAGFGGGSSLDTAKLVALLVRTPQDLSQIYGIGLARGPRLPLVQIPTTAGTGSEVTPISIVTTPSDEKKGVVSSLLYPDVALLDSLLTLELPPRVTAMTGIDAMVHAIESYSTRLKQNPLSEALALKAISLLYRNIRRVLGNGHDADAREAMLLGSLFAGMAFANAPVAAVHALAYPLGAHFHVPHGLSNSLVLMPILEFNLPLTVVRYADLGRAMVPGPVAMTDSTAADAFLLAMCTLLAEMPYERRLQDVGVAAADLPMLATDAMKVQRLLINNPRDLAYEDALSIYQQAF
ncbi:iron-containing alcohol dehydrogenase [Sphaerotilaceae bacterium SBD11-9]